MSKDVEMKEPLLAVTYIETLDDLLNSEVCSKWERPEYCEEKYAVRESAGK